MKNQRKIRGEKSIEQSPSGTSGKKKKFGGPSRDRGGRFGRSIFSRERPPRSGQQSTRGSYPACPCKTALVLLDLVQLLLLQKDLFRVLLPEVHNRLAEEEPEVEAMFRAVRVLLASQHKETLQPGFIR